MVAKEEEEYRLKYDKNTNEESKDSIRTVEGNVSIKLMIKCNVT